MLKSYLCKLPYCCLGIFASFRTASCKVAVLPSIHIFGNNSFKSGPLQTKLIPKLNSNVLNILTSKGERENF